MLTSFEQRHTVKIKISHRINGILTGKCFISDTALPGFEVLDTVRDYLHKIKTGIKYS